MWYISSSESESRSESSSEANGRNFSVGATNDAMCGARCSIRRPLCSAGGPMTCFRTIGFVELLVRLVALTEKGHDCVTGPRLFKKTVANSLPCGRVLKKKWQKARLC